VKVRKVGQDAGVRKALGAIGVSLFLLVVPAAEGATEVGLDRDHGVRFIVDGPVLTVRLEPQTGQRPPDVREDVWGRRIGAACSPVFSVRPRRLRRVAVTGVQLWPEGQLELNYTFERDISDRVKWCLLEDGGTDVAGVTFERFIRILGSGPTDKRIGRRLRRHLQLEGAKAAQRVTAIVVTDGAITIGTDLAENRRARRIARRLCELLRSSGVPDPPAGSRLAHSVFSRDDATLGVCVRAK
jgi:hypothetical protein